MYVYLIGLGPSLSISPEGWVQICIVTGWARGGPTLYNRINNVKENSVFSKSFSGPEYGLKEKAFHAGYNCKAQKKTLGKGLVNLNAPSRLLSSNLLHFTVKRSQNSSHKFIVDFGCRPSECELVPPPHLSTINYHFSSLKILLMYNKTRLLW